MPPVQVNENVRLYSFRLPTSENIYLFHHGQEITMIDAGYGVYYEDIKNLLRMKSLEPSQVRRIFLSPPDADHAGTAEYFADEFGTKVFLHPGCKGVIRSRNRAYGLKGRLANLNKYYTRLINTFTGSRFHKNITYGLTAHSNVSLLSTPSADYYLISIVARPLRNVCGKCRPCQPKT